MPGPNLTSQNLTVPALMEGSPDNITAEVLNNGALPTGVGFDNIFEYSYTSNTGPWTQINTVANAALANGAVGAPVDSVSFTPPNSGNIYIQHCVDHNNDVAETDESAADQCSVMGPINVVGAPAPGQCGTAHGHLYDHAEPWY